MKIVMIHGQNHKGSTYHIAHILAEKIGGEVTEFFLPRDFGSFCIGCAQCFTRSEECCPHREQLLPITKAVDAADLLILASPVYVYHASGSMKAWLDHYGYQWMIHRPKPCMFSKQAVCLSTAAGAGTKSTNKDMADSLFFWGVGKIYQKGWNVGAVSWNTVKEEKKVKIEKDITALAEKIKHRQGKVHPGIKTRLFFQVARMLMCNGNFPADQPYWKEKGWTEKKRPWHS